ncbi:hypothetical protein J6590_000349 [Homalodisca vitripennis]|nr:hypothetical protein J6590_000349 [Homalodisca vitripennis]
MSCVGVFYRCYFVYSDRNKFEMADDLRSQDIRNVLEEQMSDVSDSDISADNFPDDYNSNPGAGHSLQRLPGRQERLCIVCGHTKKGEDQDSSVQDAILVFIELVFPLIGSFLETKVSREEEKA